MAKKHQKLEPHELSENVWWYEGVKGIELEVVTPVRDPWEPGHTSYVIPWSTIRAALARKDKPIGRLDDDI